MLSGNCGTKVNLQILLGLNSTLDEVHGRNLGTKPLPTLRAVLLEVRHEESCRKIMVDLRLLIPLQKVK